MSRLSSPDIRMAVNEPEDTMVPNPIVTYLDENNVVVQSLNSDGRMTHWRQISLDEYVSPTLTHAGTMQVSTPSKVFYFALTRD